MGGAHTHHAPKGRSLIISIILNAAVTLIQIIAGVFSGSLSLLSDALHNFSDVVSLLISYFAHRLSFKQSSQKQTFGYKRAEILAAFINSASLLGISIVLCVEAAQRLLDKTEPIQSLYVIVFALLGAVVNASCVLLLKEEAHHNLNMKSAYLHLLSDLLVSIAVMLGGILMYFFKIYWLDSVLTIALSIYLLYCSLSLLIKTLKVIMLFGPEELQLEHVQKEVLCFKEIENIHHIHCWQLTDQDIHFEAHLDFKEDLKLSAVNRVTKQIEKMLCKKFSIKHIVLQAEIGVEDSKQLVLSECEDHH